MFIVTNYPLAVFLCVITMFCWGSWANTQKIAGKEWRFELFYWDYVIGIFLFSLLFSFTLGSHGDQGRPFIEDIKQAGLNTILSPLIGGAIFNLANILLVAAIAIAGMAVAFPVGVGIAMVLGVIINFFTSVPEKRGDPVFLFIGVLFVVTAIVLDALSYKKCSAHSQKVSTRGIVIAIIAGVLMSVFYRFITVSMVTDFTYPEPGKLTPYTALFFFSAGILVSNFFINTFLMARPIEGPAVHISDYFRGSAKVHLAGILGGLIWGVGTNLNVLASGNAGTAISYGLGQGATLVAALWGVFIWKEFAGSNKTIRLLLSLMFLFFIAGIALVIIAGL